MSLNINKLYKGLSGFGAPLLKQEYFCCYCLWTINHDRAAPQPLDKLLIYESLYLFSNLTTLLSCLFSCMTRLSQWHVSRGGVSPFKPKVEETAPVSSPTCPSSTRGAPTHTKLLISLDSAIKILKIWQSADLLTDVRHDQENFVELLCVLWLQQNKL